MIPAVRSWSGRTAARDRIWSGRASRRHATELTGGAKREIYLLIRTLADHGRVVLARSTELVGLVGLADRIVVFYRGRLTCEIAGVTATDRDVLHAINTGLPPGRSVIATQEGAP